MSVDSDFEKKLNEQEEKPASDAEQLSVLVGDTKPSTITVTDLSGKTYEFPIETFSNYKTAQVLKMLAAVKNKVNIAQLLSEILALTKNNEQLACPHCWNDGTLTLYSETTTEVLDKETGYVGCNICARPYYLKDAHKYVSDKAKGERFNAALEAIPHLMEFAPDLLVEYASLALIPNAELKTLSKKPNGIAKAMEEKQDWLQFECGANVPLRILVQSISSVGLGFLISELGNLDKSAAQLLTNL